MKKLISILSLLAILLSLCACSVKKDTQATTASTGPTTNTDYQLSNEEMFGHINQLEPVDGVYQIWSAEGVQNIANHPDASFALLCDVDMAGAVIAPIGTAEKPFTGDLNGGFFNIRNFTVQGGDEDCFGFVGVNKGKVYNLLLDNVTFAPGTNAQNIGTVVGVNEGSVSHCTITGAMTVETAAANASCGVIGTNTGDLANLTCTVDISYTAEGAANVGGLVGTAKGGSAKFLENHGKLTVSGADKTTGLFAGSAENAIFSDCMFGGADNSLNGKLFTNFTGNEEDDERAVAVNGKWRDNGCIEPLPENVMAVREKTVKAMYDLCTVEWRVPRDLVHTCYCQLSGCHGTYSDQYTYYGAPYNHKSCSLSRINYCLNEDRTVQDWFYDLDSYDGFDIYIGSDCSSTVQQAWWAVSNSTNTGNTSGIPAAYGLGTIAVGDYKCDFQLKKETRYGVTKTFTAQYIEATEEQVMLESYAAMLPGDAVVSHYKDGGHTRMVATFPVIIRDQEGKIDPVYSYVLMHEQGSSWTDEEKMITSSCKTNEKYTFASLYGNAYVPVTCEELLTGELEPAQAQLLDGCEGYAGMFTGKVQANYHLDYVKVTVTDEQGNVVMDHPIFPTAQKADDYGNGYFTGRSYTDSMYMADFAAALTKVKFQKGKDYQYTITASLATFEQIVVHEGSFHFG